MQKGVAIILSWAPIQKSSGEATLFEQCSRDSCSREALCVKGKIEKTKETNGKEL